MEESMRYATKQDAVVAALRANAANPHDPHYWAVLLTKPSIDGSESGYWTVLFCRNRPDNWGLVA